HALCLPTCSTRRPADLTVQPTERDSTMAGDVQTKSGTEAGVSHLPGPDGGAGGAARPGRRRPLPARRAMAITAALAGAACLAARSEEHTAELQSPDQLV